MRLIFVSIIIMGIFACMQKKNVIRPSYSLLNKIDSNNFSFDCIDSLLTGKTVVFLGGGVHSMNEGNLRLDLIKYLHQKHGFNLVLHEAPFLAEINISNSLKNAKGYQINLYDTISKYLDDRIDEYEYSLFEYVYQNKQLKEEIELLGLDIHSSYRYARLGSIDFINMHLKVPLTNEYFKKHFYYLTQTYTREPEKKNFMHFFENLLNNKEAFLNDSVWNLSRQAFILIKAKDYYMEQFFFHRNNKLLHKDPSTYYRYRDSIMALNFAYYRQLFPDRKMIVLTSTYHVTKGTNNYEDLSKVTFGKGVKTMGQHIVEQGEKVLSLITIVNRGEVDPNRFKLVTGKYYTPRRQRKSLEYNLNKRNVDYSFIDFHKMATQGDSVFTMYPFYIQPINANWSKYYDGAFFIKYVGPSKIIELYNDKKY